MEQITQELGKAGKEVSLSERERHETWQRIMHSMRREGERKTNHHPVLKGGIFPVLRFLSFNQSFLLGSFIVIAFFSLTLTVSAAVTYALPGDSFYPMKIRFEDLAASFRMSAKAKGVWEAERAVLRLEEAELLAASAALDVKQSDILRDRFLHHWKAAQKFASGLSSEGDASAASAIVDGLDSSMRAHGMVLRAVNEALEHTNPLREHNLQPLLEDVEKASVEVERSRTEVDDAVRNDRGSHMRRAAQERMTVANGMLDETRQLIKTGSGRQSTDILEAVEGRMHFAERMLSHAKRYVRRADYASAFDTAYLALRALEEGRVVLRMERRVSPEQSVTGKASSSTGVPTDYVTLDAVTGSGTSSQGISVMATRSEQSSTANGTGSSL
ncbi:MAG: hypothetical protein WCV62_06555 [Candidatus Peribacteraceae bacterium]|jgi:hypothetical protein